MVLCDERVKLHAETVAGSLPRSTRVLSFALGEPRKRLRTVERVHEALLAVGADRRTLIIGVGGGVGGDLFGFAAATYMRGVPFLNVATSLVAQVDASIGGKTGVDLAAGKNLVGLFVDPIAVIADVAMLETLPLRHLREGLGEVVKHAMLAGPEAFARLEALAATPLRRWPWADIVAESLAIKAGVVAGDRREAGARELLNLGHTFAHGLEYASAYRLSHGSAVAIGLRAAGLLALRHDRFSREEHARLLRLLERLGLPLTVAGLEREQILLGMRADKKARAGHLRFVLPRALGAVDFGIVVDEATVLDVLDVLLLPPAEAERTA